MRLRNLPHLIRRFFGSLRARRPSPSEQRFIAAHLVGPAAQLFAAQAPMDQRHSLECARRVAAAAPGRGDLIRAALLHDVGKNHSGLGVLGRSVASLAAIARFPVRGRFRAYLSHGRLGADDLTGVGESGIVVAFAAAHHEVVPPSPIDATDWAMLRRADGE